MESKKRDKENERLTAITSEIADELIKLSESEEDAPMYVPFIMSENLTLGKIGHLVADSSKLSKEAPKKMSYKEYN